MSDEAIVVVSQRGATVEIPVFDVEVEVDTDFHAAIEQLGTRNCLKTTSAKAPMSLEHNTTKPPLPACNFTVKPMNKVLCGPRFSHVVDGHSTSGMRPNDAKVMTWTTLSAAGAFGIFASCTRSWRRQYGASNLTTGPTGCF